VSASALPAWAYGRARTLSVVAILISLAAWSLEWTGVVSPCAYCQVQRTIIGLLGLIALLPQGLGWPRLYVAHVLSAFGAVSASTQHMNGWIALQKGELAEAPLWANSFVLSACALAVIVGQWLLLQGDPRVVSRERP
jgi:disulfide bond formation protein DsbB